VRVAFGFAYFCGLRANEIGGLRPGDIDFGGEYVAGLDLDAGALRITRKGGRIQVLPWLLMAHWVVAQQVDAGWPMAEPEFAVWQRHVHRMSEDAVEEGREWLFDWHLSASGVPAVSNCVNKRLEYRRVTDVGLHRCRHSFVTNMGRAGFSAEAIKDLVGHRSIATTLRYLDTAQVASEQLRQGPPGWRLTDNQPSVRTEVAL
jgi:integrase